MAAAIAVLALVFFPLELLITCGLLLGVALVWRSRSPRAGGSGLMPMAVVWGSVGALVLSVGAVAARSVIPGLEAPSAALAPSARFGWDPAATGESPAASTSAAPSPTISVQSAEAAQHLNQASVPQAPPPPARAQGGGESAEQPAAPAPPAAATAPQPASAAPPAAAPQPPPAAAARASSPAPTTSAPASTPAPSPSQVPEKQDCLSPLNGLVTLKVCG